MTLKVNQNKLKIDFLRKEKGKKRKRKERTNKKRKKKKEKNQIKKHPPGSIHLQASFRWITFAAAEIKFCCGWSRSSCWGLRKRSSGRMASMTLLPFEVGISVVSAKTL